MRVGDVAADLYGRTPAQFVAARNEQVRAAKAAGDMKLAADIAALRKPTVAAWTVNMLVRAAPDEVAALLRLGADLRTAQRELSGKQLRSLTAQRRQVVDALAARAGAVAAEHGQPATDAVLRQVGETLTAALADPEVAERVRTATLASAANYAGFGPVGPDLAVVREDEDAAGAGDKPRGRRAATNRPRAKRSDDEQAQHRARREEELRAAQRRARSALDAAEHDARQAAEELRRSEGRLAELRAELAAAEEHHRFAQQAERAARRDVRSATTELERAQRKSE
ncbi:hypothetical protein IU448_04895 [Nocardia flavorosea]|uniref:hypothetical protein n=1 Tax=Nocardia flavorosea TaxID=53429 RepID=UPI00189507D6|nr:hypothetical protein [Nocardia flavorosea]MBF6348354.1 hypothetical protein [Nocardia flavorosea]